MSDQPLDDAPRVKTACQHAHGEYDETYQHCLDCGREVVLIGGWWFGVEAWVRVSTEMLKARGTGEGERDGH